MRTVAALLLVSLVFASPVNAHDVIWLENEGGTHPNEPLVVSVGPNPRSVYVDPALGEDCTVFVTLDPHPALVKVTISSPNPDVAVSFDVEAQRVPTAGFESLTITGNWRATGLPSNPPCGATSAHPFSVPVVVRGATTAQQPNATTIGDPVSTSTGEITASWGDFSLGGPASLRFARTYGSQMSASGIVSALGSNWMHNFDTSLTVFAEGATVTVYPGAKVTFSKIAGGWRLASPAASNFQLLNSGGNYEFVHPAAGLIYTFSGNGKLTAIRDRNGNTLTVNQGAAGPMSVADGLGRTLAFSYASDKLAAVTDQSGRSVTFAHSGNALTAATDANGRTSTHTYVAGASPSLLTSTQRPVGNTPWTQQFDAGGRVTAQKDSFGNTTAIVFDQPLAGARMITDPLGATAVHLYEGPGNLSQRTDPSGQSTQYDYDASSRLTRVTDRLGNETDLTYDPASGYLASTIDAEGNLTTYVYATQAQGPYAFFNLTGIHYADGSTVAFTHDSSGNVVGVTDQAGKPFTATYNARGQLLTATNPAGGVVSLAYAADGTAASITDAAGKLTTYTYDARKRLSKVTFADGAARSFAYDGADRLLTQSDERGNVMSRTFDGNGNLKSITDPLNRMVLIDYDTDDLVSAVTDPLGKTAHFQYDALGSLTSSMNATGETLSLTYDALSRLISVADPSGKGPSFAYDEEGNLASTTDALGNLRMFATDRVGRRIRSTSPKGEIFSRSYDAMGRLASTTDSLAQSTSLSYDSRGLLTGVSAPGSVAASYSYDDLGLLRRITDPNGHVWNQDHDAAGRLLSRTDPLGRSISYTYDARHRVKEVTSPEGTQQITRDAAGNVVRRQYSDGLDLTSTFDAANRPTAGTGVALAYDANGRIAISNGLAIARDATGRIAGITYGPGKTVTYAYDARGLLATVTDWAGGSAAFTYDAAARVTRIDRANGVTTRVGYDENSRVVTIGEARGGTTLASTVLQRDALGRVVSATRNFPQEPALVAGIDVRSFDAGAQLAGATYDGLGRITGDAARTYGWDLASRLKSYASPAESASFTYDTFGLRTSRTVSGGSAQSYVLNYALGLPSIALVRSAGVDIRYYVYLPDGSLLYAIDAAGNAHHYYHFDEIGSTIFLTGDTGNITDSYGITPYGETVTAAGTTPNPFTWLGRWGVMQEGTTGLYYMRARYYDSASARFLSRDPIRQFDPRTINPYQYASGDPLSRIDPTGAKAQGTASPVGDVLSRFFGTWGFLGPWTYTDAQIPIAARLSAEGAAEVASGAAYSEELLAQQAVWQLEYVARCYETAGLAGSSSLYLEQYNEALRRGSWLTFEEWYLANAIAGMDASRDASVAAANARVATAAAYASRLRNVGNGLVVVGGAFQTGLALAEDVHNGGDIVVTTTDVSATAVSVGALAAAPPLALVDLGTGGAISGGIHNALMTPNVVARVLIGRVNSGDQAAIKATYTRFAVGRWAWKAGEYWASCIFGD